VSQLSFFSAESVPPAVADLTGILAAPGQVVLVGDGPQGPVLRKRHPDFVFAGMRTGEELAQRITESSK